MITDKKIAKKQFEKRFNFFLNSLQKRVYANAPLDYEKIFKKIPLSEELDRDEEILTLGKKLLLLETQVMKELIDMRLKTAEKNKEMQEVIEKRLAFLDFEPSLLQIVDLIF